MPLLRPKDAAETAGVSLTTLRRWESAGIIEPCRTYGNHRRFDSERLEQIKQDRIGESARKKYAYCRVSSPKQKDDLSRQVRAMRETYPDHEIITDIGSGLNFRRKGFLRMVDEIMRGEVETIVVTHRDRLCRFAFELFEWICERGLTSLVVQDQEVRSAERELSEDLMAIVHVFSCRHHGIRRYAGKRKHNEVSESAIATDPKTGEEAEDVDDGGEANLQHGSASGERQESEARSPSQETGGDRP